MTNAENYDIISELPMQSAADRMQDGRKRKSAASHSTLTNKQHHSPENSKKRISENEVFERRQPEMADLKTVNQNRKAERPDEDWEKEKT